MSFAGEAFFISASGNGDWTPVMMTARKWHYYNAGLFGKETEMSVLAHIYSTNGGVPENESEAMP